MLCLCLLPFFGFAECDTTVQLEAGESIFFNQTIEKGKKLCLEANETDGMIVVINRAYNTLLKIKSHYINDVEHEDVTETPVKDSHLLSAIDFGRDKVGSVVFTPKSSQLITFTAFLPTKGCHASGTRRVISNVIDEVLEVVNENVCYFNGYSDEVVYDFGKLSGNEVVYYENNEKGEITEPQRVTAGVSYVVVRASVVPYNMSISHVNRNLDFTEVRANATHSFGVKLIYGKMVKEGGAQSGLTISVVVVIVCIVSAIVAVAVALVMSIVKGRNGTHQMSTLEDNPGSLMGTGRVSESENDIKSPLVSASPTA